MISLRNGPILHLIRTYILSYGPISKKRVFPSLQSCGTGWTPGVGGCRLRDTGAAAVIIQSHGVSVR